jgi:hypothetical protein
MIDLMNPSPLSPGSDGGAFSAVGAKTLEIEAAIERRE